MKKLVSLTLVITIVLSLSIIAGATQVEPYSLGDVNGDGFIDSSDALEILKYEIGLPNVIEGNPRALAAADIFGNGVVDSRVALEILKLEIGLPSLLDNTNTPVGTNQSIAVSNIRFDYWFEPINRDFRPALLWDNPADTSNIEAFNVSFFDGNEWLHDFTFWASEWLLESKAISLEGTFDYWTRSNIRSGNYNVRIITIGKDGIENSPAVLSGNTLSLTLSPDVVPLTSAEPDHSVSGSTHLRIRGEFNIGTIYIIIVDDYSFTAFPARESGELRIIMRIGNSVTVRSFEYSAEYGNASIIVSAAQNPPFPISS
ncbi:MAG: dockerin type I repeat-containing protein [Oscillospiraceae bacterium]|jgi:hypothetical protein|nr:dockerin type I repeat-containing protein [Oscillospiraceae bacterium]